MSYRLERDSLGEVAVPSERLYGAQTGRSLLHFWAGGEPMPSEVIHALLWIKNHACQVNASLGLLSEEKAKAITAACDQLLRSFDPLDFPLVIWQTGSGTQTHMNVNEVLANLASEYMGAPRGSGLLDSHDDINRGQSSNDIFPTAMHLAAAFKIHSELKPSLDRLLNEIDCLSKRYAGVIKVGRTHCMDAAALTYGDVFGSFKSALLLGWQQVDSSMQQVYGLALGASAVGTGLNCDPRFAPAVIDRLGRQLQLPLYQAADLFNALSGHEPLIGLSSSLRTLSCSLFKMAGDIRLLASGPRCGLGELSLPENEPGSSIMPGKVNPTQCESLSMIALQVMGMDGIVAMAAAQGQFELNVYKPLIIHNVLRSIQLLSDAMAQFTQYCLKGLTVNEERTEEFVRDSLMSATVLNEKIGYDSAAKIVQKAKFESISLKQAGVDLGLLSEQQFNEWVNLETMVGHRPEGHH